MPIQARIADAVLGGIGQRRLRDALALVPTGVVITTAATADGGHLGMTLNSFVSVSLDPPLLLFCIDRRARGLPHWLNAPGYAINVLARTQTALSNRFARPDPAKWEGVAATPGMHGAPLLDGAIARFECAAHARFDGGDHVIFLARVERLSASASARPLVFHRGRYAGVADADPTPDDARPAWPLSIHY